jgi:nucleotide-binding universal stress UspA family protein
MSSASSLRSYQGVVLVACDGTPVSGDALFTAARLAASALGGVLQVLGVCLPTPRLAAETDVVPALSELDAAHCNAMQQDIQRALSISPAGDPSWPVTVRVGSPPRVLAAEAVRRQAVVIVMGIGRHHPLDRAFGAETTIATLRESRVPVLAVASHVLTDSLHAVVGLDFSSASVQAARLAARLVAPNGRLTLLHVQPRFEQATANWQAWDAEYTRTLPPLFDAVRAQLTSHNGVLVETVTVRGDPAASLLAMAQQTQCDLIAVGTQRYSVRERLIVGSVATRVLRSARCSVLAVPA